MTQQTKKTWSQWLSEQWHIDVTVTPEQGAELTKIYKSIGRGEFDHCVALVASANEPSRSVRYLIGIINNRKIGTTPKAITPKSTARVPYVYHRCDDCNFINKVRKDVLDSKRGNVMRCGGDQCNTSWMVDDVLAKYERETGNV